MQSREKIDLKRAELLALAEKAIKDVQLPQAELYMQLAAFYNTRPL